MGDAISKAYRPKLYRRQANMVIQEINMNKDIAEGKWQQMKGKVQQKWGDLTNDDLDRIKGQREEFAGVMKERYGKNKEEAEQEFDRLRDSDI